MKKIKLIVVLIMVGLMLALAAPAQACACGGVPTAEGARGFAEWFNSQPYDWRSTAKVRAPAEFGWALSTDYYMVGMNLCGQTVECF